MLFVLGEYNLILHVCYGAVEYLSELNERTSENFSTILMKTTIFFYFFDMFRFIKNHLCKRSYTIYIYKYLQFPWL